MSGEGNPYTRLAESMGRKASGAPAFRLGTVISAAPLRVSVAGTEQAGNIWMAADLLAGRELEIGLSGSVSVSDTLTPVSGPVSGTVRAAVQTPPLAAGDTVLLLSLDDQEFYLVCKVVKAP